MGSFLPQLRAFGTAGLCTLALFAIAAWLPNDVFDFVAWLIAIFLGLPVSILTKVYADRSAAPLAGSLPPPSRSHCVFLVRFRCSSALDSRVAGLQRLRSAVTRVHWPHAIVQALLPVALIGLGYRFAEPAVASRKHRSRRCLTDA